jgi:hypothetical protein
MNEQKDWSKRWEEPEENRLQPEGKSIWPGIVAAVIICAGIWIFLIGPADDGRSARTADSQPQEQEQEQEQQPSAAGRVSIVSQNWSKGGFGNIMLANMTIENRNEYSVRDIRLNCITQGASGTALSWKKHTLYDIIPARGKKTFREVNLGFIDQQSARASCEVTGVEE